jgi:hypothetical protein
MSEKTENALSRALYKMLRPMVRLLLRRGISYRLFADVARHVYVDVAEQDFAIPGRKPSFSRTAVLTGINRKDIAKLKERPHPLSSDIGEKRSPSARLIDGWINDRRFHDDRGLPSALPIEGRLASFQLLVTQYCSDVPVRAMLDELMRIGAVQKDGESVLLTTPGYVPYADVQEQIRILGTAASDLLTTLDYNLSEDSPGTYLQRTVSYQNIPTELLERVRDRSREEGEAFLLQVNEWLAQYDRDHHDGLAGSGKARAGLGIYYFEHKDDSAPEDTSSGKRGANNDVSN